MTWAVKRQFTYIGTLFLFLAIIGFFIFRKFNNVEPTCFDNKKNGDEVGIDCGGGCLMYCPNELSNPKVRWSRSFEIVPGMVHSIAYVEHNYPVAAAKEVNYQFKLYDDKGGIINEKNGKTYISPFGKSAIVETLVPVGNNKITTTKFSFTQSVPWQKISPEISKIVIRSDRALFENFSTSLNKSPDSTRLTVVLENKSKFNFEEIEAIAILYDYKDNAITVSKILVPNLGSESSKTVYFTWPYVIEKSKIRNIEIIPRFNPFELS